MTELLERATCLTPLWRGAVPSIPASRIEPVAEDDAVLMWVRHGTLTVQVEGREALVATAGQAVWVPPGLRHSVDLARGGVALPLLADGDDLPEPLVGPCVVAVPPDWSDWIVHRMARSFGFSSGAVPDRSRLRDLLAGLVPAGGDTDWTPLPPMPRSPGPRAVVDRLLRDPACAASLTELASGATTSPRTLQRQLRAETGCSLAQWRTAIRTDAAAAHLAAGRDIGWTAHRVGYASITGFTHAFTDRMGVSPGRFAAGRASAAPASGPPSHDLASLVVAEALPTAPPPVPAVPLASWITPFDSVLWVYRGAATIEMGGRRRELTAGDVVWLGRGLAHELEVAEGSVVLPLGWKPGGRPVRAENLRVVRMPQDEDVELYLLHTVVANHFLLRPRGHDEQAFLDLLHPVQPVPEQLPAPVEAIVTAVIEDPSDRRSLAAWSCELDVDAATLRRDFELCLGAPFPRWRATARMTEARALMWDGHPPSVVARRLGYAHVSAFSRAFSTAHGMPPREWLRRDAG
ncbi:AraC family transcriptional regulator [Aeromicrobium sp. Leaf350]|uniref:AraC family transcriptional regulator n=1 Tax=Aeromicrobium sp. Leaf350 TaxID=2876565 RepID=UPI001E5E8A4C|nr:AraC family transcriptional regulator [Aeromicrobium sp. Leaf350]